MYWKGKELKSLADIQQAVVGCRSKQVAQEFLAVYSAVNPHARENIGYLTGYLDEKTATRVFDWFDCEHPWFGKKFPTPAEAFEFGVKLSGLRNPNPWFVGALQDLQ